MLLVIKLFVCKQMNATRCHKICAEKENCDFACEIHVEDIKQRHNVTQVRDILELLAHCLRCLQQLLTRPAMVIQSYGVES